MHKCLSVANLRKPEQIGSRSSARDKAAVAFEHPTCATGGAAPVDDAHTQMRVTVRTRRSLFFARSHAAGAQRYIVYNRTLIAGDFVCAEKDYGHLTRAVQRWELGSEG